jgi:hypothetical protein
MVRGNSRSVNGTPAFGLGLRFGYWPCLRGPFVTLGLGYVNIDIWFGLPSYRTFDSLHLNSMSSAPRDGTPVLLRTRTHGYVEAYFTPGEWSDDTPISPREYSGAVWVCGDDLYQIEVEECPAGYNDGEAVGWLHKPAAR